MNSSTKQVAALVLAIVIETYALLSVWRYNQQLHYLPLRPHKSFEIFKQVDVDDTIVSSYDFLKNMRTLGAKLYTKHEAITTELINFKTDPQHLMLNGNPIELYEYTAQEQAEELFATVAAKGTISAIQKGNLLILYKGGTQVADAIRECL